ncbi:MAG: VWA domain-containing protein [Woeseia sp.]|nr:VWA domain-containing protein [Woeseia sp.]MBT8097870.1 VWA domain-containing protein [Woeseia sp.]NNE60274.1 VWA domain-containing protein [Woeseia sp.]NNL54298.1 VWA domain-containing protein [Woeseia sp.]
MPADFHFMRPEWLLALPLLIIVTLALASRRLAPGSWQRVIDPALLPYVLSSSQRRAGNARWWLTLLGGTLAILALAGPAWDRVEQSVYRSEQALVVALDLSRSMDAQDISPNRLTRARLKILDMLGRRSSGQTALVVYSANAFTVTPLTKDVDTVAALVNSLSTDIMPSRGSYPVTAIEKGRQLLEQAGVRDGEVLLITDGGSSTVAEQAARDLLTAGYRLSVLGVGTVEGAPIPREDGGFVTDRFGQMAVPKLEIDGLQELAQAGGGRFAVLSSDNSDIDTLLSGAAGSSAASDDDLATDQWREEGPWLLLLLTPLAALAFRRGWVLLIVFALLPLPRQAQAFDWLDLWKSPDQQASELLAEGDAAAAADLFRDPDWQAVANYRAGRYAESMETFAAGSDADSHYNLGNTLARQGKFDAAIAAYEAALAQNPDDEDAVYNRDLLQQLKDAQDAENEQNQESSGESGGDAQQSEGDSQSDQSGEQGEAGNPGDEAQDGDANREQEELSEEDLAALQEELQRAAEEAAEQGEQSDPEQGQAQADSAAERREQEQQQAMEQWLRRIPNDPGGLLRRKFRYQYQRQGRDQDGNNLWPDDEVQPW